MNAQRVEPDPAKRAELLKQAQQIYVVDDPARVWFQFGVSPILTTKSVTGMQSYADRIPRFETAQLAK
jgi:ABC-type transport system substrate-binding protein